MDKHGDERVQNLGEWLSGTPMNTLCEWIHKKRKRTIITKISPYSTWNMNDTLAMIILPMLHQLKATKHGSPMVSDEDVPHGRGLRSSEAPPKENDWDTDDNHHRRWNWVLDEMIWAFTQLNDEDNDKQFRSGVIDFEWVPSEAGVTSRMTHGPKHTATFDNEGYLHHQTRIIGGTTLFGRYFGGLWD